VGLHVSGMEAAPVPEDLLSDGEADTDDADDGARMGAGAGGASSAVNRARVGRCEAQGPRRPASPPLAPPRWLRAADEPRLRWREHERPRWSRDVVDERRRW
jgi:hypothetical protein